MELNTIEKFLLLAHHPKKAGFISSLTYINTGFAGSVFLELALLDKISIKKRRVFVKNNDKNVDHSFLNEVLSVIIEKDKPRTLKSCILSLYRKRSSHIWVFLEEMEAKKLVRIENKRFLWLIPYKKNVLINKAAQKLLITELKSKIKNQQNLTAQDRALFGLIEACKLYPNFSSQRKERKEIEQQIKRNLLDNSPIENSIDDAVHQTIKITIATMYLTVYYVSSGGTR
ncbi:MAG TPA: GPP34 family phosphoprotein [Brumimicrobium sp.]|nr:GPP34 family phosphoprotein [Brumimicrobium sp.]